MSYYAIQHSLNLKIMGNYPQVKEVIYHCHIWNDPKFIGRFHFEEIKEQPIIANPVLYPKAKLTDLIYLWDVGFTFTKLISRKLKTILENQRENGLQFIQCSVFQNGIEYEDYWLLNMYEVSNELINFSQSKISVDEAIASVGLRKKSLHNIETKEEFDKVVEKHKEKLEVVNIDNAILKENISSNFFLLKNPVKYVVSKELKQRIELAGCTGIEFVPVELSLIEWLHGGERERIYGKA